jgi:GT2 family glycosyltransferase
MSPRVTLVMSVYNQLDLTRACLESLAYTTEPFRLVVIDNGSTDDTPKFFADFPYPYPVRFDKNAVNMSVIATLNRAWRLAETDYLCFLHNDTEMVEREWLARLLAALAMPRVGLAGLYGIKRVRANGRYVGRTIVHSLAEGPTVAPPWEDVAVVDSVVMCLPRALMESIGGFDEGYGFYHGLDRDLSFAVRERGQRCVVVHAPFVHKGGATRTREFRAEPARERADLALRQAVLDRFVGKYRHRLPCDVRPLGARARDWLRDKLGALEVIG